MKNGKAFRSILLALVLLLAASLCACLPHRHQSEKLPEIPATCTENGRTGGRKCTLCGQVLEEAAVLPKLSHVYEETVQSLPTCTEDGTKKLTCKDCGDSRTEPVPPTAIEASALFERVAPSVAEILTYDAQNKELAIGSGFVYAADGKIITNYHVIEDACSASVTLSGKSYTVDKVLSYDIDKDIAVLKIDARDLPLLPLCSKAHKTGATVYAFGSSKGLSATFSNGIITHAERDSEGVKYVQHNADISGGNSGGPLINEYGEIIGINTFTLKDSQNLNFAIHLSELETLANKTPMTLRQVYEKECDVYTKLKTLAMTKGEYRSSEQEYALKLSGNAASDEIEVYLFYEPDTGNVIPCCFFTSEEDGWEAQVFFEMDKVDGVYKWYYFDDSDNYLTGTLYAASYDKNTLLGISDYELNNTLSSVREMASSMMNALCGGLNQYLASVGVSAKDLGFQNY